MNNHTLVWGSWYDRASHTWGYACCHQTLRNTYCTGEAGKAARAASMMDGVQRALQAPAPGASRSETQRPATSTAADMYGEVLDVELDPKKLQAALKEVTQRFDACGCSDVTVVCRADAALTLRYL